MLLNLLSSFQVKIVGDGNCLFRSFTYFLYNHENVHKNLRMKVIDNVVNNWIDYLPFYDNSNYYFVLIKTTDDYKNYFSKLSVYGD